MAAGDDKSGLNIDERRRIVHQQILDIQKELRELEDDRQRNGTDNLAQQEELRAKLVDIKKEEQEINDQLQKQVNLRQKSLDIAKSLGAQLKVGWKYLQDQDKIIKQTTLNLGMSGAKATAMRDAFKASAGYVSRLGGTIADIQGVMQGYADETGRARVMTADMVKDITNIGKGTGLGIEQATKLGAQFELMGFDTRTTMDYVQGVVDTSERMGVNTTKVLKVVNDNFKRLNKYTFQQGVKGFAEMAMYAEKFKIDINQALNAADVARSLEGAIDLTAKLQVMGGEFAKTDPFEMLFLSRNDPAKFTEKIADMTKGIVSFREMADGTFEKFISPADRDRLASVAESMGMEAGALTEIAERQAEIQKMRKEMGGIGLTAEQKEIVEGAAQWDAKAGNFQVKLGKTMIDLSKLTSDQADAFKIEQKSLEDRATEAMTFDETFKATIEILKTALLPMLDVINEKVLPKLAKVADRFVEWSEKGSLLKAAGMLLGAAAAWKITAGLMSKAAGNWVKTGNIFKGAGGKAATGGIRGFLGGGGDSIADSLSPEKGSKSGLFEQRKGTGIGKAKMGAGLSKAGTGAAAAGIGAGIMMAAKGIGELAQSIKDVDVDKLKQMNVTIAILGGTFAAILIPAMFALGAAGPFAALGLAAVGAAAVGVGFGVKLATEGIGKMAEGIAKMNESGTGAGKQLLGVAAGVGAITLAMAAGGLAGMFTFNNSLKRMNRNAEGVEKVGTAFKHIQAVLSGTRDDFEAVEKAVKSIGGTNIKGGGYFAELAQLLKKPLQVEFANNGKVSMTNDITLNLDGQRFMNKAYDVNIAVQKHESLKHGQGT